MRTGAQVIDVCLQQSDRDEARDIPDFYELLISKVKAPLMIDTTDVKAIEVALTYCQGKSIINSINLEDGEEKFERVCRWPAPTAPHWWSVASTKTPLRRRPSPGSASWPSPSGSRAADREVRHSSRRHPFDVLVFPCATGDENYIGGAVETIEGLRLIKPRLPHVKTVLGISNISFGLQPAAREVVNSVFLYHCTKAGLDLAIVNAEKLERFASLSRGAAPGREPVVQRAGRR